MQDGNDLDGIEAAIEAAKAETAKPSFIAVRTVIGYGSPKAGTNKVHGEALGAADVAATKKFFGFPEDPELLLARRCAGELRSRVGIISRRIAGPDESVTDMATVAGGKALAGSGLSPADIDLVIVATCSTEAAIPNASAVVADRLGIAAPGAYDLNAACAGFCYALANAADSIRAGTARHVLVIGARPVPPVFPARRESRPYSCVAATIGVEHRRSPPPSRSCP